MNGIETKLINGVRSYSLKIPIVLISALSGLLVLCVIALFFV